jgi:predicted Zn finger-like uncharacterized protein
MLIVCPNCTTSYEVKTAALGDAGRTVRCAQCRKQWFAAAPSRPAVRATTPAAVAAAPPSAVAVADRPAPAAAPSPDPIDWDAAPVRDPGQISPAPADRTGADDDLATSWDVPETPSPPLALGPDTLEARPSPPLDDIETLAARRAQRTARRRRARIRLPLMPALIAVELAAICAGLLWRVEIVHWMPQTASFFRAVGLEVNTRGLAFADVRTSKDTQEGVTVLIVEGALVNTMSSTIAVPRLRFALRNAALAELVSWTAPPDQGTLGSGEALPFRSRLASPPAGGNDISVRFLNRLDFMDGAR